MKIDGLAHVGLFVANAERSAEFYEKNLEFKEIWRVADHNEDGDQLIIFVQNGSLVIEIVQLRHPEVRNDGWFDHLAIKVDDLQTVIEKLKEQDVAFEEGHYSESAAFFENGSRWIMFRGPDHERLELNEKL